MILGFEDCLQPEDFHLLLSRKRERGWRSRKALSSQENTKCIWSSFHGTWFEDCLQPEKVTFLLLRKRERGWRSRKALSSHENTTCIWSSFHDPCFDNRLQPEDFTFCYRESAKGLEIKEGLELPGKHEMQLEFVFMVFHFGGIHN
jgi:hypothetical protein